LALQLANELRSLLTSFDTAAYGSDFKYDMAMLSISRNYASTFLNLYKLIADLGDPQTSEVGYISHKKKTRK
jgi:hypothetical protein